jgi:ribonuclease Z
LWMRIVTLGTSAGLPTRDRHLSAVVLQTKGHSFLFDCGEGTQYRLMQAHISPVQLEAIFISHLHGDHCFGLPGLLSTLSLLGRDKALFVSGPVGLRNFLQASLGVSSVPLPFPLEILELEGTHLQKDFGTFKVEARLLEHRVPAYGYLYVEPPQAGRLDADKARAEGLSDGPLLGKLKSGENVEYAGRRYLAADFLGEPRAGRRVAYCTDTRPCEATVELARGADVLIHEATYTSDKEDLARERGHSTAAEAAGVARSAGVQRLLITHFSPRYTDSAPLLNEARGLFPNTEAAEDLKVFEF